jgi:LGFP repeat-containing protein
MRFVDAAHMWEAFMPALEISQSMLVNQGLSALAASGGALAAIGDIPASPALSDIVGSFKGIVADGTVAVTDPALIGTIVGFTSPLDLATFFINAKYAELGGAGGFLGTTTSAVVPSASTVGFGRTFQNGAIYWHPNVGAHEVHGPIRVRWQELGGEKGFLGFPTSDVTPGSDVHSSGFFAHFQGGSIYWAPLPQRFGTIVGSALSNAVSLAAIAPATAPATPVAAVGSAALRTTASSIAMAQNGASAGLATSRLGDQLRSTVSDLGASATSPTVSATAVSSGAQLDVLTGIGAVQAIMETSAGAFEVHGAIREKYLALGAEASILGYPRTDETGTPDGVGRFNHFQSGSIYWTPGTSAYEVHGLIRDLWASLGWERNPQLGYPISDELIPDPRIGHRRPEVRKKPILSLPSDVIKLPAAAAAAGFPASVVNTPMASARLATSAMGVTRPMLAVAQPASGISSAIGKLSDKLGATTFSPPIVATLDPGLISVLTNPTTPASTAADQRSVNRFADFESGVLFWFRGATAASALSPLAATADGTSLSFSGADIAAAAVAKIGKPTFESANAQLASMTFIGTTGYSFDGAQVHNRRHRLQLILQGVETRTISGPLGSQISQLVPVTAMVELQVEVWFDASHRQIALTPTSWALMQWSSASYADAVNSALTAKLDPLLWTSFELLTLPDTDSGAPIAVLSVKTFSNGAVGVFTEPHNNLVLGNFGALANAVMPSVLVFSQPN